MRKIVYCVTALAETSPQAVPLGAACIASAVKNSPLTKSALEVRLAAFSLEDSASAEIEDEIISCAENVLAVCLSVFVWNRGRMEALATKIKRSFPEIHLIAGGPEITASPLSFKNADWTVSGEGEESVPQLLSCLMRGNPDMADIEIQGVYRPGKETDAVCRSSAPSLQNLASPWLDGTLDPSLYSGALWELARGCPFRCSYCYESKGEKKVRYFPVERIEHELEFFAAKKVPQVFVLDPTYNADKKRALDIIRLIKRKAPGTFFSFEARAEFIDRELARAFASIQCSLQFGLQSVHKNVLDSVNRSFNKKLFAKNIGILNQEGVVFGFDLIYGLPEDTPEGFRQSVDFALSLYPNNIEIFCLSVLPGTDLCDKAGSLGLEWQNVPPYNVIKTRGFSCMDIEKARRFSYAADVFYNKGRAVPWFNMVLEPLRIRPSVFLEEFSGFMGGENSSEITFSRLQELQLEFVSVQYKKHRVEKMFPVARDIIVLNNALSLFTAEGRKSCVSLCYHPDDLMSGYPVRFLHENCGKFKNKTQIFGGKNGADWRVVS
ncbi:B12-binding domain-containing radical SAM protein [Treponema sp.]|uniref:B12-binding domain-containing radical SAM protein n=1 Tax=Treponema sp. TaxID=166 RepID=UPI003F108E3E